MRFQEGDEEAEFYRDSDGKSGGQKEKLAYTVLAASLAYQFGLEWNEVCSNSFRFVVIDEAFGCGSDESTRYALKLFQALNLQLLISPPYSISESLRTLSAALALSTTRGAANHHCAT